MAGVLPHVNVQLLLQSTVAW